MKTLLSFALLAAGAAQSVKLPLHLKRYGHHAVELKVRSTPAEKGKGEEEREQEGAHGGVVSDWCSVFSEVGERGNRRFAKRQRGESFIIVSVASANCLPISAKVFAQPR